MSDLMWFGLGFLVGQVLAVFTISLMQANAEEEEDPKPEDQDEEMNVKALRT